MKKYKALLRIEGEETLMAGSPMTLSSIIESEIGKKGKNGYNIVEVKVVHKNDQGDLDVVFYDTKYNICSTVQLIAPLQFVGDLSNHDNVLETLANLTFLNDLEHDRVVQIMEYPVEANKVLKEGTLFELFKWCGERIEGQMATPVEQKIDSC